jgi:20S proteasome alpha/beta subunit
LSTVGLLATTSNQHHGSAGEIHLVDTTGIIKCRAYAIGKHSTQLNERLMKEQFQDLDVEEGAQLLLKIIQECSEGSKKSTKKSSIFFWKKEVDDGADDEEYDAWEMTSTTFVEIAVIDSIARKMKRLRQPLLAQLQVS